MYHVQGTKAVAKTWHMQLQLSLPLQQGSEMQQWGGCKGSSFAVMRGLWSTFIVHMQASAAAASSHAACEIICDRVTAAVCAHPWTVAGNLCRLAAPSSDSVTRPATAGGRFAYRCASLPLAERQPAVEWPPVKHLELSLRRDC